MNITVFTNCQGHFIYSYWLSSLPYFINANYTYIVNYGIIQYDPENVKKSDIFIYQPIEIGLDEILQHLKPECIKICLPVIYVDAFPIFEEDGKYVGGHTITKYIDKGMTLAEILHLYDMNKFDFELNERFIKSIAYLQKKEHDYCNIKVSEFILAYYKTHKLFTTQNHPNGIIGCWVAKQICSILGIDFEMVDEFTQDHREINGHIAWSNSNYMKLELDMNYINFDDGYTEYRDHLIKVYNNRELIKYKYI